MKLVSGAKMAGIGILAGVAGIIVLMWGCDAARKGDFSLILCLVVLVAAETRRWFARPTPEEDAKPDLLGRTPKQKGMDGRYLEFRDVEELIRQAQLHPDQDWDWAMQMQSAQESGGDYWIDRVRLMRRLIETGFLSVKD